jgi:hypothetical protein
MITSFDKAACYSIADQHWTAGWIKPAVRSLIVQATIREFEAEAAANRGAKPSAKLITQRVKQQVQFVIPAVILFALVGWLVTKLLDWLWDRYTQNQSAQLKANW